MSTVEETASGTIALDPVLVFGLVLDTPKTKTWTKTDTPAISYTKTVASLGIDKDILYFKNFSIPTGVTFLPRVKIRVKVPINPDRALYVMNSDAYQEEPYGLHFGFKLPGATTPFSNTGKTIIARLIDGTTGNVKSELTIPSDSNGGWSTWNAGDIVEVECEVEQDWAFHIRDAYSTDNFGTLEIEGLSGLSVTMYHDGTLSGGTGVVVTFDLVDEDGVTVLISYEIDGLVSPFTNMNLNYIGRYRLGGERVIEVDSGNYDMDAGAPDAWMRFEVSDIKVGGVSIADSDIPSLFDKLILSNRIYDTTPSMQAEAKCDVVTAGSKPCQSSDVALPKGASGWKSKLYIDIATKKADALRGKRIEIPVKLYVVM